MGSPRQITLLVLAITALALQTTAQLTCTFSLGQFYDPNDVASCVKAIPYNASLARNTVDSISKAMELYAFKDIVNASPNPEYLPVAVPFAARLRTIRNTVYATDFDFHDALSTLFNDMKDAHTSYTKPGCYALFSFTNAFSYSFSSIQSNGDQVIILNDPSGIYDKQVVSMLDGLDAIKAIWQYGVEVGRSSMDLSTRFQLALKGYTTRALGTYSLPKTAYVTLQMASGQTLRLNWRVTVNRNVTSFTHLQRLCLPVNTDIRNGSIPYIDYLDEGLTFKTHEERLSHHQSALKRHVEALHESIPVTTQHELSNQAAPEIIYETNNLIFSMVQPGVGALKIPSFFPSEFGLDTIYSIKSIPEFLFDMQRVYVLAYEQNIKEMIIDLRGNGGGWVCLAMEFLRILFPGPAGTPPPGELFDIKSSSLLIEIAKAAAKLPRDVYSIFSPWKFFKPSSFTPYSSTDWLLPGKNYVRGGILGTYSEMVTDDCTMVDIPAWDPKFIFSPSKVLILTDGTCGSACALVARNIQERQQASILVVGGVQGRPQMVASFIGGLVYDLPTLLEELKLLGLSDHPLAPQPLPTSASLRFTLWEQYPWVGMANPPIPAEFVFQAADYRMLYSINSYNNNKALYQEAYQVWKSSTPA